MPADTGDRSRMERGVGNCGPMWRRMVGKLYIAAGWIGLPVSRSCIFQCDVQGESSPVDPDRCDCAGSLSHGLVERLESPASAQPKPEDYSYDLERALSAVVGLRAIIPPDAFTADTLGTERAGNGVLIRADGLVLTIGYLITEAETIWLTLIDGRRARPCAGLRPGDRLRPGAGAGRLDLPALPIGDSAAASIGERVVVGGAGGRQRSVAARIVAKQEFAGYWEYVLDEAIFTSPSHPNWGGTALIGPSGELIGIGSLQLQRGPRAGAAGRSQHDRADRSAEADPRRSADASAAPTRRRGRGSGSMPPRSRTRSSWSASRRTVRRSGGSAHRRRAAAVGGTEVDDARRALSQGLVARRGRRRRAVHDLSRRQDLRRAGEVNRPRALPQGAQDALSGALIVSADCSHRHLSLQHR